ncbi:hypothetical protein YC2023_035621 [Brassica napus]
MSQLLESGILIKACQKQNNLVKETRPHERRGKRGHVSSSLSKIIIFPVCPNFNPSFRLDFPRLLRNLIVTGYESKAEDYPLMEGKWVGRTPEGVGLVVKLSGGD